MAAFDDNFELMPATAPPNNPPSSYSLEVSPTQSYLNGVGWVVQHGTFTYRFARKANFSIPDSGWAELEIQFSSVSGFIWGLYNNDIADSTAMAFSMQTYNGGAGLFNNNTQFHSFNITTGIQYKFRIDRNGNSYRFRGWSNGVEMFDQTTTAASGNDGFVAFRHSENPVLINRIAGDDGTLPAPNPLTLVEKTSTSVTLECPVMPNAVNYFWYRVVSSAWVLEATTTSNSVTISDLPPNSSQQFKMQYGVLP